MMAYRKALLLLLGAALLLAPLVSAQQDEKVPVLIVVPGNGTESPGFSPRAYDTIVEGETDYFTKYVGSGVQQLTLDLNWGNPSNSLSLIISTPVGSYGPYYDSFDGIDDGRIVLAMIQPGQSLPAGTWNFQVYGERVSGTEDYSFLAY